MLSGGAPRELLNAIAAGDTARFQAVPGIGKRTAERIIVELREKVAGKATDDIVVRRTASDDPRTLAREGLLGLGFTPQEADGLLDQAGGETPEELIAERAEGGAMSGIRTPGVERIQDPAAARRRGGARPLAAPEAARRLRRPGARQGAARDLHRGRPGARRGARPRAAGRARPGSARPRSRRSSPTSWAPASWPPPARRSSARATWRATSPRSSRAASSSSTRSTASRARSRRPSIRRWRTASCRSPSARARARAVVTLDLPDFTLIGATTRTGLLTTPLRDRFGVTHRLELYEPADLARIVRRSAGILDVEIDDGGRRGDRRAARAARRAWPTACSSACATSPRCAAPGASTRGVAREALDLLEVDAAGPRPPRPRDPARDLREVRRRPGGAVARWRSPWARSRTRSRTSTSPICSSRAS